MDSMIRASGKYSAAIAAIAIAIAATALPARAADDGQQSVFSSFFGMVGLGAGKADEKIDYRERPPLVLPPKMELPQPQNAAAEQNPAWPLDPDVVKRRKEAAAASLPRLFSTKEGERPLSRQELARGAGPVQSAPTKPRDSCSDNDKTPSCIYVPWDQLSARTSASKDTITAGQEPERATLTDPPKGYRQATKTITATTDTSAAVRDNPLAFFLPKKDTEE